MNVTFKVKDAILKQLKKDINQIIIPSNLYYDMINNGENISTILNFLNDELYNIIYDNLKSIEVNLKYDLKNELYLKKHFNLIDAKEINELNTNFNDIIKDVNEDILKNKLIEKFVKKIDIGQVLDDVNTDIIFKTPNEINYESYNISYCLSKTDGLTVIEETAKDFVKSKNKDTLHECTDYLRNTLLYILNQQGYKYCDLFSNKKSPLLSSIRNVIRNLEDEPLTNYVVSFNTKISAKDFLNLYSKNYESIIISKNANLSLISLNSNSYLTQLFTNIELEKDLIIPITYVNEINISDNYEQTIKGHNNFCMYEDYRYINYNYNELKLTNDLVDDQKVYEDVNKIISELTKNKENTLER